MGKEKNLRFASIFSAFGKRKRNPSLSEKVQIRFRVNSSKTEYVLVQLGLRYPEDLHNLSQEDRKKVRHRQKKREKRKKEIEARKAARKTEREKRKAEKAEKRINGDANIGERLLSNMPRPMARRVGGYMCVFSLSLSLYIYIFDCFSNVYKFAYSERISWQRRVRRVCLFF